VTELEKTVQNKQNNPLRVLILCRMENLTMEQQLILKYASIIGNEFKIEMLRAILPDKIKCILTESLELLADNGFIVCLEETPGAIYEFQNELIQTTLYELMPPRFFFIYFCYYFKFCLKFC
jgi:predicted ATPase